MIKTTKLDLCKNILKFFKYYTNIQLIVIQKRWRAYINSINIIRKNRIFKIM